MSMDASVLKEEIIAAIESAMSSVDMDPATNPDLSSDVSNALWGAVADSIVEHLKSNASLVVMSPTTVTSVTGIANRDGAAGGIE